METTRQQKINRLLQKELGNIFQNETKQMRGVLISISEVRITPDLGLAKIYLSIFPNDKGEELIKNIKENAKAIRFDLGQRVGKQLRIVPEVEFFLDNSIEYLEKIDKLLGKIDSTKQGSED